MIRQALRSNAEHDANGFRYRGTEMTRLEAFSDVVFGFALTLLVVSLEVPKTFGELSAAMREFPAFAICFALLIVVWHHHCLYFRRFGLQDGKIVLLNSLLLFTVLFYVYPLKFLFGFLVKQFSGGSQTVMVGDHVAPVLTDRQVPPLMLIYGLGFAAIFGVFAIMYWHALGRRDELELNELEIFDTTASIREHSVMAGVGLASCACALLLHGAYTSIAGWIYAVIWPIQAFLSFYHRKRRKQLAARLTAQDRQSEAASAAQ